MKIRLKKKEIVLVVAFGVLLAAFLIQKLVFQPLMLNLKARTREIIVKEAQFTKMLRIGASSDIIEKKFEDFKTFIEISGTEENKLAIAMSKIEEAATKSGISLQDVKPQAMAELELDCRQTMIRIIIVGTQQNFLKFVYQLESCELAFSVANLDMKVKSAEEGLFDIDLIIAFTYFIK